MNQGISAYYGMRTLALLYKSTDICPRPSPPLPSQRCPSCSLPGPAMALANLIVTGLQDIQATRFSQLASSAIIVFDHVITLDEEVELIWKSSWSMGKVLFIINRYYTLTSVIVNNYALLSPSLTDSPDAYTERDSSVRPAPCCILLYSLITSGLRRPPLLSLARLDWSNRMYDSRRRASTLFFGAPCLISAPVILQMRLYALYFLNKKVLALMVTMFIISSASSAAIMGTVLEGITAHSHPLPGTTFCVPTGVPNYFFAFWIPILCFESLLCGLALYRGFQTFRATDPMFQSGRHLVAILIRDSVFYFLVMFATYLTNMLVWISASSNLLEIPIAFAVALSCCLGNRMILNVREVNREMDSDSETEHTGDSVKHQVRQTRSSFFGPSQQLSDIEMAQLRSMRAEQSYGQFIVL
ncbi:hypothetical protein MSAN_01968900 [Mycena sanguinolenta]|uniref:DUF6533 domain-containing protein n=1 Tax=Mycena sanguinolenta TaxID=230812 RepID=A0A8H6XNW2_9AGAR|nr:hypothetical protein MSAN_01968900 [Mycena sanguinolenta]